MLHIGHTVCFTVDLKCSLCILSGLRQQCDDAVLVKLKLTTVRTCLGMPCVKVMYLKIHMRHDGIIVFERSCTNMFERDLLSIQQNKQKMSEIEGQRIFAIMLWSSSPPLTFKVCKDHKASYRYPAALINKRPPKGLAEIFPLQAVSTSRDPPSLQ